MKTILRNSDKFAENEKSKPIFGEGLPLPAPQCILFKDPLNWEWDEPQFHGLENEGSICFMNSVIQCLQYVPIWSNYLWHQHKQECKIQAKDCFTCLLSMLTCLTHKNKLTTMNPFRLRDKLPAISKDLVPKRQHDAHEFLTCFFERMQECQAPKPVDPYVEMTTAVGQIFGGFLRSQIACQECLSTSNTYEQYFNISLNIEKIDNLQSALNKYFEIDVMDDNPWYSCDKCKKHTKAAKRYTIETLPEVLIFQLKRYDMMLNKLRHSVQYPRILQLDQYMSSTENSKQYKLYGMIDHSGKSLNSGHCRAYVSQPVSKQYNWHCIDDDVVYNVTWPEVASKEAYLIFYIKCDSQIMKEEIEDISSESFRPDLKEILRKKLKKMMNLRSKELSTYK